MKFFRTSRRLVVCLSLLGFAAMSGAQDFPLKPIRIIVPLGTGSIFDSSIRKLAEKMAPILKQPVVVINKPGGQTAIGVGELLRSPADGYTLIGLAQAMMSINQYLYPDLGYSPEQLTPVAGILTSLCVFVVPPQSEFKTFAQLMAAAKAKPGTVSLANYAIGYRFGSRLFEQTAGVQFNHVPYQGAAQTATDVAGGNVDAAVMELGGALPLIRAGRMRALAMASRERAATLPDVPTVAESGYPGFSMDGWTGLAVSAQTPKPIVKILEAAILQAADTSDFKAFLEGLNSRPLGYNASQMASMIEKDTAKYKALFDSGAATAQTGSSK